jgi:hypothetical protein
MFTVLLSIQSLWIALKLAVTGAGKQRVMLVPMKAEGDLRPAILIRSRALWSGALAQRISIYECGNRLGCQRSTPDLFREKQSGPTHRRLNAGWKKRSPVMEA